MQSKWFFLVYSLISLFLTLLPEFISDEMKAKAISTFGKNYDIIWIVTFLLISVIFIFLTWKQFKNEKDNRSIRGIVNITNSKNVVTGNIKAGGNVRVGDEINQFGLKPREVSEGLIAEIERRVPSKIAPVSVYQRGRDTESYEYATKIVMALKHRGFANVFVNGIIDDRIIGGDPEEAAKHQREIGYRFMDGQLDVIIPSNQ